MQPRAFVGCEAVFASGGECPIGQRRRHAAGKKILQNTTPVGLAALSIV
jgi:hypothetical protein